MTENQSWWANLNGHDRDEVVEVTFEGRKPVLVHIAGTDIGIAAHEFVRNQVRLIERVLPAGRAAAALTALSGLPEEERLDVLRRFCSHCGDEQGDDRCQCWNDE